MLTSYAKREWLTIIFVAAVIAGGAGYLHWWWSAPLRRRP